MNGSIFPGEKWYFFMWAIAEGKTIEKWVGVSGDPEVLDAILHESHARDGSLVIY